MYTRLNTFEKYFSAFNDFIKKIIEWEPDYIVPVAKKGCKVLKTTYELEFIRKHKEIIKYRKYFELNDKHLYKKKIAILDDATQYTSTLKDYRNYFEKEKGGNVRTFSFIGHEDLLEGKRWKEDELAEIEIYLPEPSYQEYILQQAYFLAYSGKHFDLDHIVFELPLEKDDFFRIFKSIRRFADVISYEELEGGNIIKFSASKFCSMKSVDYLNDPFISPGWIQKVKLAYSKKHKKLLMSPMIFPTWNFSRSHLNSNSFSTVPFLLPFDLPNQLNKKDKSIIQRAYHNIYYISAISLFKLFLDKISSLESINLDYLKAQGEDLEAIMDSSYARTILKDALKYLRSPYSSHQLLTEQLSDVYPSENQRFPFKSFEEVVDYLKKKYKEKTLKKKTFVGIHYYISYDELFKKFENKEMLSENIDHWCDLGVIVGGTFIKNGFITRGVRTGEPKDLDWERTQVLIPIAIQQFCKEKGRKQHKIEPTILDKMLANFIYDYPSQGYGGLHCIIGEPYTYGAFISVQHYLRSLCPRNIYSHNISKYYLWDDKTKMFQALKPKNLAKKIEEVFDEKEQAPYSEIVAYFRLLACIYTHFKNVEVLNMLSICREFNCFFAHVHYNVQTAYSDLCDYIEGYDKKVEYEKSSLHNAYENTKSALQKLTMAEKIEKTLNIIENKFGSDLDFIKIVKMLKQNYEKYPLGSQDVIKRLKETARLEFFAVILCKYFRDGETEYKLQLEVMKAYTELKRFGISDYLDVENIKKESSSIQNLLSKLKHEISLNLCTLPKPAPPYSSRDRVVLLKRARNKAASYVYHNNLAQAAILYIDFTGLRMIPEPKENIISRYYDLVEQHALYRGKKIYGGDGGDDAYIFIFEKCEPAICCAEEIKKGFMDDLFLSKTKCDIKFGLSYAVLEDKKEVPIIRCMGLAKDCCEYKSGSFRNRGHLLVDEDTAKFLNRTSEPRETQQFVELTNECLSNGEKVFYYLKIEPIKH